jgi:hypothetical protein
MYVSAVLIIIQDCRAFIFHCSHCNAPFHSIIKTYTAGVVFNHDINHDIKRASYT